MPLSNVEQIQPGDLLVTETAVRRVIVSEEGYQFEYTTGELSDLYVAGTALQVRRRVTP